MAKPISHVDHIVVAADTLARGVQWCEATLGVTPGPGGDHPLMGTHNRVLPVGAIDYPRTYLEIIAVDPAAPVPRRRRWFDLDDEALRQSLRQQPRLIHFVACTPDPRQAVKALGRLGIQRGSLLRAERATAHGLLSWQISVRGDGQRLFYGGLPTLIQWDGAHPADAMPDAGLALQSVRVSHPRPVDLRAAHAAIGLQGVVVEQGPPNLVVMLGSPRGVVQLESAGV